MTNAPKIRSDILVDTAPDDVWDALTGEAGVAALYFGSRLVTTFAAGAPYRYEGDDGNGNVVTHVEGEILACEPRALLSLTHRAGPIWQKGPRVFSSRLTYRLAPEGRATRVTIEQDNFDVDDPGRMHNEKGWPEFLAKLKAHVESVAR
jgi:uncharacterized protein YndB with AHSA1/START domain